MQLYAVFCICEVMNNPLISRGQNKYIRFQHASVGMTGGTRLEWSIHGNTEREHSL